MCEARATKKDEKNMKKDIFNGKIKKLKLERKGDRLVSFRVIDTLNDRVVFTGLFQ